MKCVKFIDHLCFRLERDPDNIYFKRHYFGRIIGVFLCLLAFLITSWILMFVLGLVSSYILGYDNRMYDIFGIFVGYWSFNWDTIGYITLLGGESLAYLLLTSLVNIPFVYAIVVFINKGGNISIKSNIGAVILIIIIDVVVIPLLGHVEIIDMGPSLCTPQEPFSDNCYLQGLVNYSMLIFALFILGSILTLIISLIMTCYKQYKTFKVSAPLLEFVDEV
jgi:hypothetical protein